MSSKSFEHNFTSFRMAESHIFCYLIPSEKGDTAVGQRRLNWVWYWNLTEANLDPLLTDDANGVRRACAIPPGALDPGQESKQCKIAERVLPPAFKELIRATKEPFVQEIMDLACPQLVFNHAILMGDASFVIRPHTQQAPRRESRTPSRLWETGRKSGIIRIARSLAAVRVESRPAPDELWARSRPVAKALVNPRQSCRQSANHNPHHE
jgi:hypothetical protein